MIVVIPANKNQRRERCMQRMLFLGILVCAVLHCSPTSNNQKTGQPGTLIKSSDFSKPPTSLSIVLTSTGKPAAGLQKIAADSFSYPVQQWMPSAFYTGCPDYLELSLTSIFANGRWMNIKIHVDTIVYDTIVPDSMKSKTGMKKITDTSALKDTGRYWDTIIVKSDTVYETGYRTLWTGKKAVRFDGSAVSLTNFDTLHIPLGTLYGIFIEADPVAKTRGSVRGLFTFGRQGDTVVAKPKTYYTKSAHSWNAQTNNGGSIDPSVYETGPAEEMNISIMQWDPNKIDAKAGPNQFLRIENLCTTSVYDSMKLTVLFDISRTLTFYNGDTINKNQAPSGAPYDKAYFTAHESFCGDGASIAALFPGKVGCIEGYKIEYVWSQTDPDRDADSAGPWLQNDTTFGGLGWLTIMYGPDGKVIGGKMFQDNGTFCPKGTLSYFNASEQRINLGLGYSSSAFQLYGFKRGTTLGDVCFCRVFSPKWSSGGQQANARSGEMKLTLALLQQ
jgi:hypothetical protein